MISNILLADDTVILKKGDAAPWDGILFSQTKAQEVKYNLIEKDALSKINTSLNTSLNLQSDIITKQQEKVAVLLEQNDKLAKSAYDSQYMNDWVKFAWFGIGIATTCLVLYGVQQIQR